MIRTVKVAYLDGEGFLPLNTINKLTNIENDNTAIRNEFSLTFLFLIKIIKPSNIKEKIIRPNINALFLSHNNELPIIIKKFFSTLISGGKKLLL